MTTITFDTRKAVRNLKAAGIAEAHADAIVDSMADAFGDNVATKTDIAEVKAHIARLETAMWKAGITLAGIAVFLNRVLDWLTR